jgi:hypothetical protein
MAFGVAAMYELGMTKIQSSVGRTVRVGRTVIRSALLVLLAGCSPTPPAATEPDAIGTAAPIPAVVLETWAQLHGTWITDNAEFKSDQEPFDAYAIDWRPGIDGKSLTGRLYGLTGGREAGTFWEFREFWHPGDQQLITTQFGMGGTYGAGPHTIRGDGTSEMLQTFYSPAAGTVTRIGHRSELRGTEHVTRSFDVQPDGGWVPRRVYTWHKQPAGD